MDDTLNIDKPTPTHAAALPEAKRGWFRRLMGGIWWLLTFIPYGIMHFCRFLYEFGKKLTLMLADLTRRIAKEADGESGYLSKSLMARVLAIVTTGMMTLSGPFAAPVASLAVIGSGVIVVDQVTAPDHTLDASLMSIDTTPDDGKPATTNDIGAALFRAVKHQMLVELETPVVGWTPNDQFGFQLFDNRVNRQLGVQQAAIGLMGELKHITNYGDGDNFDQRILTALSRMNTDPYMWFDPGFAESGYYDAFAALDSFTADVRLEKVDEKGKMLFEFNIINSDQRDIFDALKAAVGIANGRLIDGGGTFDRWFTADDDFFYAQGIAIVVRDVLVVMRHGYEGELVSRKVLVNVDEAISALNEIINAHPAIVFTSSIDSMVPDHRAKLSQKFNYAEGRLTNAVEAFGTK